MAQQLQATLEPSAAYFTTSENLLPSAVPAFLDQQRAEGHLGDIVIVHVGTNGSLTADQFAQIMQRLVDAQRVVFVNDKVPRPWEAPNNAVFEAEIPKYSNAVLVDWHAFGMTHPELFYDDGIHLRPDGLKAYAALIAAVLDRQAAPTSTTSTVTQGGQQGTPPSLGQPAITPSADCEVVSNRSGTLSGCIRPSEQPAPGQTTMPNGELGSRVYDTANSTLIGYIGTPDSIGFVPLALVPQYDALVACNRALTDSSAAMTSECRQLLLAQGVPEAQIDALH
jgi:hypothetical protein